MPAPAQERPLMEYHERLPQVRRSFALHPDRVEVVAAWTLGKQMRTVVQLSDLDPTFTQRLVRNRWFKKSILVGSLAVGAAVVLRQPDYAPALRQAGWLFWAVAGAAFTVSAVSFRRRKFVLFPRRTGGTGLDLCDAGPDSERFDAFVASVQKQIRARSK